MSKTAQRTDPKLWEKVKSEVTRAGKGGEPGQWSARKAQLAAREYEKRGGGYQGDQSDANSLKQWSDEEWGTKSGRDSRESGEGHLPKKRTDMKQGAQISGQPEDIARTTARDRSRGKSAAKARRPSKNKDEFLKQARHLDIEGRSNMLKAELEEAVRLAKH
jgi:hypothetical protein